MNATQLELTIDRAIEKNASIQELKTGQRRQGGDIQELKDGQKREGGDIQVLKDEQHRQGVILEDIQSQIQTIAEAVTPLLRKSEAMPEIKSTFKSHSQEITMTQQSLKHHIKDPNAHSVMRKS